MAMYLAKQPKNGYRLYVNELALQGAIAPQGLSASESETLLREHR